MVGFKMKLTLTIILSILSLFIVQQFADKVSVDSNKWHFEKQNLVIDWDMRDAKIGRVEIK